MGIESKLGKLVAGGALLSVLAAPAYPAKQPESEPTPRDEYVEAVQEMCQAIPNAERAKFTYDCMNPNPCDKVSVYDVVFDELVETDPASALSLKSRALDDGTFLKVSKTYSDVNLDIPKNCSAYNIGLKLD